MPNSATTIGFIGVGGIGRPMAEQLAMAGFDLIVCDKRNSALEPFQAAGVRVTTSASDCAAADIVILMVADDDQVIAAVSADDGLLQAIDAGRPPLVAVMSTVLPETVRSVAALLSGKNAHVVDAPVSGGTVKASRGELSIIAGGAPSDLTAMAPIFDVLGSRIFHSGALGTAVAIKILNNLMGITTQSLMTEIGLIADRLDIDMKLLVAVMEAGSGRNFSTLDYDAQKAMFRNTAADPALLQSHVNICRKDLDLAQTLAEEQGVSTPLLDGILAAHRQIPYEETLAAWKFLSAAQAGGSARG